jgi:hypothetical protein
MNGRKKASMASFQGESKSAAGAVLGVSGGSVMAAKIDRTFAQCERGVAGARPVAIQERPATLFESAGLVADATGYRLTAIEVKETAFRLRAIAPRPRRFLLTGGRH